jgi:hypothetical protein
MPDACPGVRCMRPATTIALAVLLLAIVGAMVVQLLQVR